jgi:hypothetical protein
VLAGQSDAGEDGATRISHLQLRKLDLHTRHTAREQ